jgi:hypothetical protein
MSHSSGSESGSDENTSDIIDYGYEQEPSSQDVFNDEDRVALDEMLVDLKGMMGSEGEVELWHLRECLCFACLFRIFTFFFLSQEINSSVILIATKRSGIPVQDVWQYYSSFLQPDALCISTQA